MHLDQSLHGANLGAEDDGADRLGEIVVTAGGNAFLDVLVAAHGREEDDRRPFARIFQFAKAASDGVAVNVRKHDVEQHEVRTLRAKSVNGFVACLNGDRLRAEATDVLTQNGQVGTAVFYDEDFHGAELARFRSRSS